MLVLVLYVCYPSFFLLETVYEKKIKPPAIFIVGEVVTLREKLKWFDNRALFGKKIINTRAAGQAREFTKKLETLGFSVNEVNIIEITEQGEIKGIKGNDYLQIKNRRKSSGFCKFSKSKISTVSK